MVAVFKNRRPIVYLIIGFVAIGMALYLGNPRGEGDAGIKSGQENGDQLVSPRFVETGYYSVRLDEFEIPQNVIDGIEIVGRVVEYIEFVSEYEMLVLIGSNSLDLGIQPPEVIAGKTSMPKSALVLARVSNGELEFSDDVLYLDMTESSLSQVRDLYISSSGQVLISNVDTSQGCFSLDLWRFDLQVKPLQLLSPKRLFRSQPCLDFPLQAAETGGRIVEIPNERNQFLLTVGSFGLTTGLDLFGEEFEGRPEEMAFPNTYGMTVIVDGAGRTAPFTVGHRNPQGLLADELTGRVLLTEQGPRGGDELNLLEMGQDYGWPNQSVGTPYVGPQPSGSWSFGQWGSQHDKFTRPIFSWVPSIAPNQLVRYTGREFAAWNRDLLIGTLRDQSLRRIRISDNNVVVDERIDIGRRVRDLTLTTSGKIVMSFDDGFIGILQVGSE